MTHETEKKFTIPEIKTLLKWKKVKVASSKKRDLVDAYVAAPKPKIQKVWCRSEEEKLVALKSKQIPLKDTALGVAATQMAKALTNNLTHLDESSIGLLKAAINNLDAEESQMSNII